MPLSLPLKFTNRYVLALSLVAFLMIVGQILVQQTIQKQLNDSKLVNYAGRQRFQSQQIAKTILLLSDPKNFVNKELYLCDLKRVTGNWERYHQTLQSGDIADLKIKVQNSDTIRVLFQELEPHFQAVSQNTRKIIGFLEHPEQADSLLKEQAIQTIFNHELLFLKQMDKIVFRYDKEAKEKIENLRKIEIGLLFITLFVLLSEAFFIFRPAVRALHEKIVQLISSETQTARVNADLQRINGELLETNRLLEENHTLLQEAREKLLEESKWRFQQELSQQKIRLSALLEGQEEERKRMSRELHDGLGQMLTGLKLISENIKTDALPEKEKKSFDGLKILIVSLIQETRNISYNLMSPVLEDFGIEAALRELVEFSAKNSQIRFSFQGKLYGKRFDKNVETGLYRISQEAINNAIKHAQASEIDLEITHKNQYIELTIEDNGKGFRKKNNKKGTSQGLQNMQERAKLLDGQFEIISATGKGTKIWLSVAVK